MHQTKKCKYFQCEIDQKAKVSPNCKRKQEGKGKSIIIGVAALFITCAALGCGSESNKSDKETLVDGVHSFQVSDIRNENLNETVVPIDTTSIVEDGYRISIIGASFDKSTGDTLEDVLFVGMGLKNQPSDNGMNRGFDMGFKNSSDAETAKKDAYLSLYLYFEFDGENIAQRDSIIPELTITGTDNRGESVDLIHMSCKDEYVNIDYPYAVIIIKTYFDSETIELQINDSKFTLDTVILKE